MFAPGRPYLHRLPPQDEECFGSLSKKSCELVDEDVLDFIRLLDLYADSHAVDAGLNEDTLVLVARNSQRIEQDFRRASSFYFRNIVPFRCLRRKIGQRQRSREGGPDALQVWTQ